MCSFFPTCLVCVCVSLFVGCSQSASSSPPADQPAADEAKAGDDSQTKEGQSAEAADSAETKTQIATFAGGCFWCMEPPFDKMDGVLRTTSGYIGGRVKDPTYKQVSSGSTGHLEALEIEFDPNRVTYEQLLTLYWHNVDPTQKGGQFCDRGSQYRTAIFYHDDEQKKLAQLSKQKMEKELGQRLHTELIEATDFYHAEEYHQDYYTKNPTKYKFYRWKCGRDAQLDRIWGDKARQP